MKIVHFGDLHLDPATAENTRPVCAEILKLAQDVRPDLIVNCGDLSMKRGHLAPWVALELRELHVALAEIAPVIVVAGNHDLAGGTEVGTVMGALAKAEAEPARLMLFERAGIAHVRLGGVFANPFRGDFHVACLPYPSKDWLLAQRPEIRADELNAALSAELLAVLHGLAAQIPAGERAILVYHGSIAGARTDSEQSMTTEMDVALNEAEIPACFEAVLCGHIHRHQQIGRAVYCGSPAPLTFAEEKGLHGAVIWGSPEHQALEGAIYGTSISRPGLNGWMYNHFPLPVAHPLITLDLRQSADPAREFFLRSDTDVRRAKVRVRLMAKPGMDVTAERNRWEASLTELGASEVRVQIERPEEIRIAGPEVRAEASVESLLSIYCERHPEAAEITDELVALAVSLEERLPADARIKAAAAGYRLLRMEWSNWKSYGEGNSLDLATLGKLIAIEGENATGKSNAAELEAFALYGRFMRGRQALSEAVRIGASECLVRAIFESNGERWKVERRIRVNAKGVGAQDLALFRAEAAVQEFLSVGAMGAAVEGPEAWTPASCGTARETQGQIEALAGPFELYTQTRFASQGEIDAFLDLTGAEVKDVLQLALATSIFEAREALVRPALQSAERAFERHEAGLAHWRELAGEKDARATEVDSQQAALGGARVELDRAEAARREAEQACEARRREAEEIGARVMAWDASMSALEGALEKRIGIITALESLAQALEAGEKAAAARAELPGLIEQRAAAKGAADLRRERAAVVEGEKRTLSTMQRERERAILRDQADRKRDRETLEAAERRAGLIARVPFGEKCLTAACPFVADAGTARESLPALRLSAATAAAIEPTEAQIAIHRAAVAMAEARLTELRVDEIGLRRIEARISELEALESAVIAGHEARAAKALREQELGPARDECARMRDAHVTLGERPTDEAATSALVEAETQLAGASQQASEDAGAVEHAIEALASAKARLSQAEEAAAKVAQASEIGTLLERARRVAAVYLDACGRDGLPFLMLEHALPALEAHANHFLCDDLGSGLRLEIEGLRELQSGGVRSEVVIRYRNDFGTHSLAAASGFERTAIGYALRASLAQVQAEAQGLAVSHWIADEGWGVFDEANMVRVGQPMLRRLAERFGQVIVISHQP